MSLPEISRRCRSCGAAVRAGARFCPQCGKLMESEAGPTAGGTDARAGATQAGDASASRAGMGARERDESNPLELEESGVPDTRGAETPREWTPPTKEFSAFVQALEGIEPRRDADAAPLAEGDAPPRAASDASSAASVAPRAANDPSRGASDASRGAGGAVRAAGDVSRATGDASRVESDVLRAGDGMRLEGGSVAGEGGDALRGEAGDVEEAGADERRGRVARVREGTRVRVEQMREEALVVLEETPDDSGLRFVVAAAALFVVFLVILFLSTTVLR
jgi:hypothetical protein